MSSVGSQLMTAEEFFDWAHRPENRDRCYELDEGEVVEMSRPGERHGTVCANVAWVLGNTIRQVKKGNVVANDTGIVLQRDPDTVKGPDVALYAAGKKYDELALKYSDQIPVLVVEVLSPTDRFGAMMKRINQFLAKGVTLVWMLDPEVQTITVFRDKQFSVVLEASEEISASDVLPDFRCAVEDFFAVQA